MQQKSDRLTLRSVDRRKEYADHIIKLHFWEKLFFIFNPFNSEHRHWQRTSRNRAHKKYVYKTKRAEEAWDNNDPVTQGCWVSRKCIKTAIITHLWHTFHYIIICLFVFNKYIFPSVGLNPGCDFKFQRSSKYLWVVKVFPRFQK